MQRRGVSQLVALSLTLVEFNEALYRVVMLRAAAGDSAHTGMGTIRQSSSLHAGARCRHVNNGHNAYP